MLEKSNHIQLERNHIGARERASHIGASIHIGALREGIPKPASLSYVNRLQSQHITSTQYTGVYPVLSINLYILYTVSYHNHYITSHTIFTIRIRLSIFL